MKLNYSAKQLGKKRPFIKPHPIEIPGEYGQPYTLQEIITHIIRHQVNTFNQKQADQDLVAFLNASQIDAQSHTGKVDFGATYHPEQADAERAIEAVLTGIEDGIIVIFLDDQLQEDLQAEIRLSASSVFTFVRLTFLAGSYY